MLTKVALSSKLLVMTEKKVLEKIKILRKSKGLTLQDVAKKSGLTKGYLSRVENGRISPSIGTLIRVVQGLEVELGDLFSNADEGVQPIVVTEKDRKVVIDDQGHLGIVFEALTHGKGQRAMQPFFATLQPSPEDHVSLFDHEGEEFIFVLEGEIEFIYGKDRWRLKEGDSVYFRSDIPHRAVASGFRVAKIIVVIYKAPGSL